MGLTVGVIGLGRVGAQWDVSDSRRARPSTHLGSWLQVPEVARIATVEVDQRKMDSARPLFENARPGIAVEGHTDISELPGCDIASVATPAQTHRDIVERLLALKQPPRLVFCEKPLAVTLEDADHLVKDCAQKGIILAVNHTRRWDPIWQSAAHQVLDDVKDTPNMAVGHFTGDLLNVGIHMADLVNWFKLGSCIEVFGHRDAEYLLFELDVFFQRKRVRVRDNGLVVELYSMRDSTRYDGVKELALENSMQTSGGSTMLQACQQLVRCIYDDEKPLCTGEDGLKAMERTLTWSKKE